HDERCRVQGEVAKRWPAAEREGASGRRGSPSLTAPFFCGNPVGKSRELAPGPRVKPFENVPLGLSVETFEMYPEVDCRRGCGKLGNAKRFPRRLRRRVFPSRFAGLVVLFSRPAPWGSPPLAD